MEQTHALPGWFIRFQDSVGLSLLVIALMGINGIVYASGVVPSVDNPASWGIFGTVLFVLFFAAGAASAVTTCSQAAAASAAAPAAASSAVQAAYAAGHQRLSSASVAMVAALRWGCVRAGLYRVGIDW